MSPSSKTETRSSKIRSPSRSPRGEAPFCTSLPSTPSESEMRSVAIASGVNIAGCVPLGMTAVVPARSRSRTILSVSGIVSVSRRQPVCASPTQRNPSSPTARAVMLTENVVEAWATSSPRLFAMRSKPASAETWTLHCTSGWRSSTRAMASRPRSVISRAVNADTRSSTVLTASASHAAGSSNLAFSPKPALTSAFSTSSSSRPRSEVLEYPIRPSLMTRSPTPREDFVASVFSRLFSNSTGRSSDDS